MSFLTAVDVISLFATAFQRLRLKVGSSCFPNRQSAGCQEYHLDTTCGTAVSLQSIKYLQLPPSCTPSSQHLQLKQTSISIFSHRSAARHSSSTSKLQSSQLQLPTSNLLHQTINQHVSQHHHPRHLHPLRFQCCCSTDCRSKCEHHRSVGCASSTGRRSTLISHTFLILTNSSAV
jgi:hypothetical protein